VKVSESDETNNCHASAGTVQITRPDLRATAVSNPPATVVRGSSISVTDTVTNQGLVPAGASTTRYYLSTDQVKAAGDRLLTGTRSVAALAPAGTSTGTVTVTVPPNTVVGLYYLLACADDMNSVIETDETNNCAASTTRVNVTR
jgi:subtilase family serine protease